LQYSRKSAGKRGSLQERGNFCSIDGKSAGKRKVCRKEGKYAGKRESPNIM
jgi:hypothetical protein